MKKYGNTNSEGLCTVKNPYESPKGFTGGTPITQWHEFANDNPDLPLYTSSGHLVKDAGNVEVEGPVSQYKFMELDWMECKGLYSLDMCKADGIPTRQIYRLLTVPPTESESTDKYKFCNHHHELTDNDEVVNLGSGDFVANKKAIPLLKALNELGIITRTHHVDENGGFVSILLDNITIEVRTVNEKAADRNQFNGKKELLIIF